MWLKKKKTILFSSPNYSHLFPLLFSPSSHFSSCRALYSFSSFTLASHFSFALLFAFALVVFTSLLLVNYLNLRHCIPFLFYSEISFLFCFSSRPRVCFLPPLASKFRGTAHHPDGGLMTGRREWAASRGQSPGRQSLPKLRLVFPE